MMKVSMGLLAWALLGGMLPATAAAQAAMTALRIRCDGEHAAAKVSINGQFRGDCPLDVQVSPGPVQVRAVKDVGDMKERVFESNFEMGEGSIKSIEVMLKAPQFTPEGQALEKTRLAEVARLAAVANARAIKIADAQASFEMFDTPKVEAERQRKQTELLQAQYAALGARPGQGFKDCPDCPELVLIAPGKLAMTAPNPYRINEVRSDMLSQPHNFAHFLNESLRTATVSEPFGIGKFELSFEEYDRCVAQGQCPNVIEGATEGTIWNTNWGRGKQPALLDLGHAQAYLKWLSAKTGQLYRTPTVAEWTLAAAAGKDPAEFPWGGNASPATLTNKVNRIPRTTVLVGSYPPNGFGLFDVIGNVAEWARVCYGKQASEMNPHPDPVLTTPSCGWLLMGGGFLVNADATSFAPQIPPTTTSTNARLYGFGLRVLRTLKPAAAALNPSSNGKDCADCPELAQVPAGQYVRGRTDVGALEQPQQWLTLPAFAIARKKVTVGQFGQFMAESGHVLDDIACSAGHAAKADAVAANLSWLRPGYAQDKDSPVSCVSKADALAYLTWLFSKTGVAYRLPSEAEWEYAAGPVPVATDKRTAAEQRPPNPWGISDMSGRSLDWVADCGEQDYLAAPSDGSARRQCSSDKLAVARGSVRDAQVASGQKDNLRPAAATRVVLPGLSRSNDVGIRLARDSKP